MIDNFIQSNQAPIVNSISGYSAINSGTINFIVDAYDANNDNLQLYFSIFYSGSWHSLSCNQFTCSFDSTIINYDNNVQVRARAHDGQEFSDWTYSITFTVDNMEEEPQVRGFVNKNKFSVVNVIPKVKQDHIELYINIKNKGNQDEDVTIKITVIQTGLTVYDNIGLDVQEGQWRTIQLPKLNSGTYVINVQAYNNKYKDNRLVVIEIWKQNLYIGVITTT